MAKAEFDENGFCISSTEALREEALSAFDQESKAALNFHQLERNAHRAGPREWREHKAGLVNYQSRHVPYYYAGLREKYPLRQVFSEAFLKQLYELNLIQSGIESLSTQVQYTYTLNPKDDGANRQRHAVICHHLLLHGTGKNTTDVTRRMVFFRLGLRTLTGRADTIFRPFPVGRDLWRDPLE